jgi:hypothetical protein
VPRRLFRFHNSVKKIYIFTIVKTKLLQGIEDDKKTKFSAIVS